MCSHRWILVTGGVSSGVGKGTCAAVLGRLLARAGRRVHYQKLEPNLATEIAGLDHRTCGEIVHRGDAVFAIDVARFAFYVPGFTPARRSDTTLGQLLATQLAEAVRTHAPAARLQLNEELRALAGEWPPDAITVLELGGTVGEPEHERFMTALGPALGPPLLHVHVTQLLCAADLRVTTKPAQLGLQLLSRPADLVVVRTLSSNSRSDFAGLAPLVDRGVPIIPVSPGAWPEQVFHDALRQGAAKLIAERTGLVLRRDPLLESPSGPPRRVEVLHDGAGPEGYASLARRLVAWSHGRLGPVWTTLPTAASGPVIRIGERVPARAGGAAAAFDIVPSQQGRTPRDESARPDWLGTADRPEGRLAEFIRGVLVPASAGPLRQHASTSR